VIEKQRQQENRFIMRWGDKIKDVKAQGITASTLLSQVEAGERNSRASIKGSNPRNSTNTKASVVKHATFSPAEKSSGGGTEMQWQHMKQVASMLNATQASNLSKEWSEVVTEVTQSWLTKSVDVQLDGIEESVVPQPDLPPSVDLPPVKEQDAAKESAPETLSGSVPAAAAPAAPAMAPASVPWFSDELHA